MVIYPAIDVLDGRCVRLTKGVYGSEKVYYDDPVDAARAFADAGSKWLHLVDLNGAKSGVPTTRELLTKIKKETGLLIQTGGGIRSLSDALETLEAGADRVIFGTAIVRDRGLAQDVFGQLAGRAVAGIDMKSGRAATDGWTEGGEEGLDLALQFFGMGCRHFIVTDIATDGMLEGPNLTLMAQFVRALGSGVIASGGVSGPNDLAALQTLGIEGVVVGKAIYEGRLDLAALFASH